MSPCRRKDTTVALPEGFLFVIGACVFIHRPANALAFNNCRVLLCKTT